MEPSSEVGELWLSLIDAVKRIRDIERRLEESPKFPTGMDVKLRRGFAESERARRNRILATVKQERIRAAEDLVAAAKAETVRFMGEDSPLVSTSMRVEAALVLVHTVFSHDAEWVEKYL